MSELHEQKIEVGDLQIHVNERGTGDPLVVLHHSTGPFWSSFYDELARTFTVIAPDMPGYGGAARLPHSPGRRVVHAPWSGMATGLRGRGIRAL